MPEGLNPRRTIEELKELRSLTGDADGAQRVAFTDTWVKARQWFREKIANLPVEVHQDAAGNVWTTLKGKSPKALVIGSHLDSVPNGGWLDGCLGVMTGLEVMRRIAAQGTPDVTVRLVDWADEEGARFGRSLFGSSGFSGSLVADELRNLTDKQGIKLPDAVKKHGVDLDTMTSAASEQKDAAAYLELHIEQGPVLLSKDLPMGVVLGTFGVERHAIKFTGQAAHSGSTPMGHRKDALGGVSKLHLAARQIAIKHGGVATVGSVVTKPGIVTSVVAEAEMTLDMRHLDAAVLKAMLDEAKEASQEIAVQEKILVDWRTIWRIQPFPFHPQLIEFGEQAVKETCGVTHRLPSGPLHDAAEVCRTGIPTVMLFVQSLHGISHNKIEDTKEEHLEMAVRAMDNLATKAMAWITQNPSS
jgi:N-carbamoyl-L-amino-acid hydrolase